MKVVYQSEPSWRELGSGRRNGGVSAGIGSVLVVKAPNGDVVIWQRVAELEGRGEPKILYEDIWTGAVLSSRFIETDLDLQRVQEILEKDIEEYCSFSEEWCGGPSYTEIAKHIERARQLGVTLKYRA